MSYSFSNWTPKVTLILCILTCFAYEAMRINGWLNRFAPGWSGDFSKLVEATQTNWNVLSVIAYVTLLLPFFVVRANKSNPKIKIVWCLVAMSALIIACARIPGAMSGRWASTHDEYLVFYWIVIILPALVFIVWAIRADNRKRRAP